jgi:hypothetical protein
MARQWLEGPVVQQVDGLTSDGCNVMVVVSRRRDQNNSVVIDRSQRSLQESTNMLASFNAAQTLVCLTSVQCSSQHARLPE